VVGNIFLRSKSDGGVKFEYWGAPSPRRTDDGFTTVGDLGWLDDEGYLYIADRRTDMVRTGGVNVYPAEVESRLNEHPDVADVAVIGLPDAEWGRRLHAIVVPADPRNPPAASDLLAHCKAALSPAKVPKAIEFIERLPRSEIMKLNRSALVAERSSDGGDVRK
jgi:bile acid-coenzyme A ligase